MKLKLSKAWCRRKFKEEEDCLSVECGIPPWHDPKVNATRPNKRPKANLKIHK